MRLKPVNDLIFPVGLFPEDIFQPLFLFLIYSPEFLIFIVYDDDTRFGGGNSGSIGKIPSEPSSVS